LQYGVGYEINKQQFFAKKLKKKTVIGDYYIMFHKRAEFLYKTLKTVEGYALRKAHMMEIFQKYKSEGKRLQHSTQERYRGIIKGPLVIPSN